MGDVPLWRMAADSTVAAATLTVPRVQHWYELPDVPVALMHRSS